MCSIGGWISAAPLTPTEAEALARALLFYGRNRGRQSAGVWVRTPEGDKLHKAAVDPNAFHHQDEWPGLWTTGVSMCLTHTRAPTCGGLGDAQAQPFVAAAGKIVTVHNGMISNYKELKTQFSIEKPSGVDSELITTFIAAHGITQLNDLLTEVTGGGAIAAVVDEELYLVRDSGALETLTLDLSTGNTVTIFASTSQQLLAAVRYCWLIELYQTTTTVPSTELILLSGDGMTSVADWRPSYRGSHTSQRRDPDNYTAGRWPNWVQLPGGAWGLKPSLDDNTTTQAPTNPSLNDAAEDVPPPFVPDSEDARAADYHDLGVKMALQTLDECEAARFAYYLLKEEEDAPAKS